MSLECWIVCGRCKDILLASKAKEWRVTVFGREVLGYACAPCAKKTFLKKPEKKGKRK